MMFHPSRILALLAATGAVACSSTSASSGNGTSVTDTGSGVDVSGQDTAAGDTQGGDTQGGDTQGGGTDATAVDTGAADSAGTDATTADVAVDATAQDTAVADTSADATADTTADTTTDVAADATASDSSGTDASGTDAAIDGGTTGLVGGVAVPYAVDFPCGATPTGWTLQAVAGGLSWAVDSTPTPPAKADNCALNFNNDTDFKCPAGVTKELAYATGPVIDATALAAGKVLKVKFALAGKWESSSYDDLDLEVSTDDATWKSVKSYDPPAKDWTVISEDLSAYAGKKFRLRLKFEAKDCTLNNYFGAFVDDWKVYDATCKADTDCDDGNACTDDKCDTSTGKCGTTNNTAACDDGDACTEKDTCKDAKCKGKAKSCDDKNTCTDDSCDAKTGACANKAKADGAYCSDGDDCTVSDACQAGKCAPGKSPCDDGNPCTADICTVDEFGDTACSVKPAADGGACDDGMKCTTSDVCTAGVCVGANSCTKEAFADPFDCDKATGWTLDAAIQSVGWAIDQTPAVPAAKSGVCMLNFNDGTDYDNGLTVKGKALSPVIDLSAASGGMASFWSYSDLGDDNSKSYDQRFVEIVVDGKVVESKQLDNVAEQGKWVTLQVDLTAYAGKKIQVQFRFDSVDALSNKKPGWFIDDLSVTTK